MKGTTKEVKKNFHIKGDVFIKVKKIYHILLVVKNTDDVDDK